MIDMTKTYRTRDGSAVRILCVDRKARCPVVALVTHNGREFTRAYPLEGRGHNTPTDGDLVEVKPTIKGWLVAYKSKFGVSTAYFDTTKATFDAFVEWLNSEKYPFTVKEVEMEMPS